jgi:hypothetical protein
MESRRRPAGNLRLVLSASSVASKTDINDVGHGPMTAGLFAA